MSTPTCLPGRDIKLNIAINLGDDTYLNLDNLTELYVYFTDEYKNVVARFSKAGTPINGYAFTALTKVDTENYKCVVNSSITKEFDFSELYIEVDPVQADADMADNKYDLPARELLMNVIKNTIYEVT